MKPELSIIIPCYNEAENIPIVLEKFQEAIKKSKIKEKTGIQTLKVNNNFLLSKMLLFKILLH